MAVTPHVVGPHEVTPHEVIAAANEAFGRHPGFRSLHAKGTLLKGMFTATPEAAALTRAGHMQGDPIPATIRVSNGGGNPKNPTMPRMSVGWP